jgi:hypothetical protein
MKKYIAVIVLFTLFFSTSIPVFAQDEAEGAIPACTEEELTATLEGLQAIDDGFKELVAEFDLTSDPANAEYGTTLVALEAIAGGFWGEFYPAVPACAEAQVISFTVGTTYDQYLTIGLLANVGAKIAAAGDEETATLIGEQVTARVEGLQEDMAEVADLTFEEYAAAVLEETAPACTEEQLAAAQEGLGTALEEIGAMVEGMENPLEVFAVTEATAFTFWDEAYEALAVCAESELIAFQVGFLLNDVNIIAGLHANAAAESEAGNAEVAEAMTQAASAREELLAALMGGE